MSSILRESIYTGSPNDLVVTCSMVQAGVRM
jgi:hypothetical protein